MSPADVDGQPDRDGKIKLGLWNAWQVVKTEADMAGQAQQFIREQ